MVIGYWEQACALLNYGLLHDDLFFETSGEFFGVWEAVKPVIPTFRERFANKLILTHLEQAAKRYEAWSERRNPGHIAAMRQMMQQMRSQAASAAKGMSRRRPIAQKGRREPPSLQRVTRGVEPAAKEERRWGNPPGPETLFKYKNRRS